MAGGIRQSGEHRGLAEINVTPLVDVILVLLIIFMVSAPMMQSGIDVNLPETTAGAALEEERVVITLTRDKKLYINNDIIHPELFMERMTKLAAMKKEVFLKADRSLPYGEVIGLIGRLKKAGIENVALVTLPVEEKENGQSRH
ncbi:MAG: ExbD/TolR family protein [Acidobacteria bacterium]|nr:ExbD/TolR family protein [Acidobacteriota bacterium]